MQAAVTGTLVLVGAGLMLIAAIGVVRMPDLFTRMQATTKAATLGAGLVILGTAVHFATFSVTTRAVAAIAFVLLTAPIAAHLLGRAAYFLGVPLWEGSVRDELRDRYDWETHILDSGVRPEGALPPDHPRA
ncbi:MAG: monovalent cation/H(+) antiporter subunit G [Chloroflexi bacterium]|nr:monovalent cation/H(+) antiporter subunit G [Chloroflexota bacterium]